MATHYRSATDPDRFAAALAPGIVAVDHRTVGFGALHGRDAVIAAVRALLELSDDVTWRFEDVLALSEHANLVRGTQRGRSRASGGEWERPICSLRVHDADGLIARWEIFEAEQEAAALARYDELVGDADSAPGAAPSESGFSNAAAGAMRAFERCWHARDWKAVRATYHPAHRMDDRRRLMRMEIAGDAFFANERMLFDEPQARGSRRPLATRGERLALFRVRFTATVSGSGPMEVDALDLVEVDADGLRTVLIVLRPRRSRRRLRRARRALAGRRGDDTPARRGDQAAFDRALANRDWDALAALHAASLVARDHRLVGWDVLRGPAAFVGALRAMADLAPDARGRLDHLRTSERGLLGEVVWIGTRDGGAFESPFLWVVELDTAGRAQNLDFYDPHHLDAARARFEALRPDPLRIPPNAATRANDRWDAAMAAADWDALRALHGPSFQLEDRRRLIRMTIDREGAVGNARHLREGGWRRVDTLLATAGDRLALRRSVWTTGASSAASEVELLVVDEVDGEERYVRSVIFDPDDRAAASDELAERYARSTFPPALADGVVENIRARRNRDLTRIRASLPDDFYFDDQRRTGLGRIEGADAYLASVAAFFELSPDVVGGEPLYYLVEASYGALYVGHTFGTLTEGGEFESVFVVIVLYGSERLAGAELFELEDLDRARARFAELRPDPLRIPENAATRALVRAADAFAARDWPAVRALTADGFVYADRSKRALVHGDVETWIASQQFLAGLAGFTVDTEIIGTLGDRIAIEHMLGRGGPDGDDVEIEAIRVLEVDATGRFRASIRFDPEDRPASAVEAMRRFVAGEAGAAEGLKTCLAVGQASRITAGTSIRAALTSDFVFVDHRTLGLGMLDGDQWITAMRALADLAPDFAAETRQVLTWNRHGFVAAARNFGTVPGGGPFENFYVAFALTAGGRVQRYEAFDPTDAERAVARFAELSGEK